MESKNQVQPEEKISRKYIIVKIILGISIFIFIFNVLSFTQFFSDYWPLSMNFAFYWYVNPLISSMLLIISSALILGRIGIPSLNVINYIISITGSLVHSFFGFEV